MKKKTLGLLLAGVAAASMIGTGFAAWIITASAEKVEEGQFIVDTVSEKTVTITPSFASDEDTIRFLAPSTGASTGWLTNDNIATEKLAVTLNVAYAFNTGAAASDFKVKYDIDYSSVQAAINAGYITAPTLTLNDAAYTDATVQALSGASEALTITFEWGSAFGGVNPYDFYNDNFDYGDKVTLTEGVPAKDDNGDTTIEAVAKEALTALSGINAATFNITITVTPASQA